MKRAGTTETLSISLGPGPLKVLRQRARKMHRGNISAAVAEAAELLERTMAMADLADELDKVHGPLTDDDRRTVDAELRGRPASSKRKRRAA
jgi:hypothetical protein